MYRPWALYVFHRHDGNLLEHVCRGADAIGKSDDAHAVLRDPDLIAHPDAPDAGHAGEALLQRLYMVVELPVIGQQHDKLRVMETLERLVQVSPLACAKKLLHALTPPRFSQNFIIIILDRWRRVNQIFADIGSETRLAGLRKTRGEDGLAPHKIFLA